MSRQERLSLHATWSLSTLMPHTRARDEEHKSAHTRSSLSLPARSDSPGTEPARQSAERPRRPGVSLGLTYIAVALVDRLGAPFLAGSCAHGLDSGSRLKPEAWAQPFPRQAPNLGGFGPRTFKLLNLSRCPALKLEEPLKDDRVALGPVRLWGLCAGGSASGSFRVHGKGPPGMGGPNPQRAPRGARVASMAATQTREHEAYPTHTTPGGAPPRSQSLHKAGRRSRTTAAPTAASGAEGRLRGRRGSKRDRDSAPVGPLVEGIPQGRLRRGRRAVADHGAHLFD
jgi:hypothetical protein